MQEIVNSISYKSMVLFKEKKEGLGHANGASEKYFEFMPSKTLENALLASRINFTLIIYLVLH